MSHVDLASSRADDYVGVGLWQNDWRLFVLRDSLGIYLHVYIVNMYYFLFEIGRAEDFGGQKLRKYNMMSILYIYKIILFICKFLLYK